MKPSETLSELSALRATNLSGLSLNGVSVLTPLGNDPAQLFYAVSSGLSAYHSTRQKSRNGAQMSVATIPDDALLAVDTAMINQPLTRRQERMLAASGQVLKQLAKSLNIKRPLPLVLAAPEKLPGWRTPIDDRFLSLLSQHSCVAIDEVNSYVLPEGRAAGFKALALAHKLMADGVSDYMLVGAVDCMVDEKSLAHLDAKARVLTQGVRDGFAPGEAAVFYLVSKVNTNSNITLPTTCIGMGESTEPGHMHNDVPYTGEALSTACYGALNNTGQEFSALYGTLNGESYYAKEWGVTQVRMQSQFTEQYQIEHPADCLGDLGAAAGLVNLCLVNQAITQKTLRGNILLTASSELGARTALWVKPSAA